MAAADPRPPRFRTTGLAAVFLVNALAGARYGGAYGSFVGGLLGLMAVPLLGFVRELATLTDQARALSRPEDVERHMRLLVTSYLQVLSALMPRRPSAAAWWPEKDSRLELTEHRLDGERRYLSGGGRRQEDQGDFWPRLTLEEQDTLTRLGETVQFEDGDEICRQGEQGDRVFVLRSGAVAIKHDDGSGLRPVAERGVGDLVGERSAFELRERSATMIAIGQVVALVVQTSAFTAFVQRFPEVMEKVERRLYERLTEPRPPVPFTYAGQNCSILMADIGAFNDPNRTDPDRLVIREVMYRSLRRACERSGVPWSDCYREDRGDGILLIVPPGLPTRTVLHPMSELLAEVVRAHNSRAPSGRHLTLRLALGVGPVTRDGEGMVGEAINITARLLDAPEFKARMTAESAPVGVTVSGFVHESVVRHLPGPQPYVQIPVDVKETRVTAWTRLL